MRDVGFLGIIPHNEQQLFTKLFLGIKDFRLEIRERVCFSSFKQNKAAKEDKDCSLTAKGTIMTQPRKFHLFNCDNVYQLSIVEDLLKATKAKLGFEFAVEKHNFTLSEMSELSTKIIPAMTMDFAMFVVHAHESVLLINNDNLEQGYTISFPEPTCLLVSTKTRSSGIIN